MGDCRIGRGARCEGVLLVNLAYLYQRARKAAVAVVGVVAMAVTAGLLNGQALVVAQAVLGLATTLGIYTVPNAPPK